MKKIITLLLTMTIAISSFSAFGCGRREQGVKIDKNRSQLNVGVMKAGYGDTWLDEAIKDFEELYKDVSFEEGKKGVQVIKSAQKDQYVPKTLKSTISGYPNAIYYVNQFGQQTYNEFVSAGLVEDLTAVLNEDVYDENGDIAVIDDGSGTKVALSGKVAELSMYDRVNKELQEKLKTGDNYYATPWAGTTAGIIYDADLFNERKFYFGEDGEIGFSQADVDRGYLIEDEGTEYETRRNVGKGPDGKLGTADDGMPATYEEFIDLLYEMEKKGVVPFTWSGQQEYPKWYGYESVFANYQGAEEFSLNYNMEAITDQMMLEAGIESGDKYDYLALQQGRKAGIQFFSDIIRGEYYSDKSFSQDCFQAQSNYVKSIKTKRIAFFMEASYWENEVRETFNEMAKGAHNAHLGYGKRNFKVFPIPNFVDVTGIEDQTNTSENEVFVGYSTATAAFIAKKNKCPNPVLQNRLAKLFLQFTNSREQLVKLLKNTGGCISFYDFTVKPEEKALLTKYGQDIFRYFEEGSDIIWNTLDEETKNKRMFYPIINNKLYTNVPNALYANKTLTVDDCFAAVQNAIRKL